MHICYLYLSSILSHRLLAESLVIKYKTDKQNHSVWSELMLVLVYKGIVWPTQSTVIYIAVALQSFLPSLKEGFCPPVATQWVFLCQAVFSVRAWDFFPQIHRICSGHFTEKLCCVLPYRYTLWLSFCL